VVKQGFNKGGADLIIITMAYKTGVWVRSPHRGPQLGTQSPCWLLRI